MAYKQFQIFGPFGGEVSDRPAPTKQDNEFDSSINFFSRKGRLSSRPALVRFASGATPDNAPTMFAVSYQDIINNYHSLFVTTQNAYAYNGTFNLLSYPGSIGGIGNLSGTGLPYGWAVLNTAVYFSNGSVKVLYTDGESSLKVAGDVPGAARYMCVLGDHLLIAYCTEPAPMIAGSVTYPRRVRWSAVGDPNTWTGNFTAGFSDILDLPGQITGMASNGRNAYIYTANGIEIGYLTGNGLSPFAFEPYSNAPAGVGNAYPGSLDAYGNTMAFIGNSEVWTFDGGTLTPIGGKDKLNIFNALASVKATTAPVRGMIVPKYSAGYEALSYVISIPNGPTFVYLFDDKTWQQITMGSDLFNPSWATFVGQVFSS